MPIPRYTLYKYLGASIAYHEDFTATLATMASAYKSHLSEKPHFKPIVKELEALRKAQYTIWTTLLHQFGDKVLGEEGVIWQNPYCVTFETPFT